MKLMLGWDAWRIITISYIVCALDDLNHDVRFWSYFTKWSLAIVWMKIIFLSHSDILKSGFHNMVASDVRVIFFTVIFWVDDIA